MYLAVDIGATKVLLACFTNDGQLKDTFKFPTPDKYSDMVKVFASSLANLKEKEFDAAVVAVPGKLNREEGIGIAFGNRDWRNVHIAHDIEQIIDCPVTIENDAKLAALSEASYLKGEYKQVLYVTISTGISAGLITDGIIDHTLRDSESGQMWFDYHGKPTQWEDFASGRAIVAKYHKLASEITDPAIWKEIAHNISVGLIELIAVIQPEVIVLGGGVGTHFEKYKEPLLAELKKYSVPIVPIPPIRRAKHPEEAVIYGCYLLAKQVYSHANAA